MQILGKVIEILPLQTGEGKNGIWKKQEVILETQTQYPKKICVGLWNDKIESSIMVVGNSLQIDVDIESRSYNGRWYTEVKAWKVVLLLGTDNPIVKNDYDFPAIDVLPF